MKPFEQKKKYFCSQLFSSLTEEQFLLKANYNANPIVCKHQLHLHATVELCSQVFVTQNLIFFTLIFFVLVFGCIIEIFSQDKTSFTIYLVSITARTGSYRIHMQELL